MPRHARIVLPGHPHHVIQRGHNRQPVFTQTRDYEHYIGNLLELKQQHRVRLHAYCLMTNHVHLLVAPETKDGIAKLMKGLAARHTQRCNRSEGRTGTMWEGRPKSSLIDSESYLLTCSRYIELNPVRAGMVGDPRRYAWSSCRYRLDARWPAWLDADPCYLAMGLNQEERRTAYVATLEFGVPDDQLRVIRDSVQKGRLTGDHGFEERVTRMVGRIVHAPRRGRPRKKVDPSPT